MSDSISRLREIVAQLRAPNGCPWDREQTHVSLKPHLLEECYELFDAIDDGNSAELREELGDLLLQVVMHSQMAAERGEFTFDSVADGIANKLVDRHPHVFGDVELRTSEAVLKHWEVLKRAEKQERKSIVDGVPRTLPALARAQKIQSKVSRVGFDWPGPEPAWEKVLEEVEEVKGAGSDDELAVELGDLLFALVNVIRLRQLDAEQLLNSATTKFQRRFQSMEAYAREHGIDLKQLDLAGLDELWTKVKTAEDSL
ncbi:MAG: nucleoside triphosphate pyrophosphohydrolase [Verrucomicrobia bacterium]|nr:nucleoside triphosphate pyrophosphohydrolase [Verrucomicrobiota bacterium]